MANPPMEASSSPLPKRHIPFGPQPPQPVLSSISLRVLLSLLLKHEGDFLTDVLPTLYPPALASGANPLEWSVAFEVLAFAAGLKQSVLIGWGDGRDDEGDARVAHAWVRNVWNRGVGQELNPPELADKPLKAPNSDVMQLRRFMDGCTFDTLGPVAGRDTIWTGHILVSWGSGSPGAKLLTSLSKQTSTESEAAPTNRLDALSLSDTDPSRPHKFDESLLAHILDYPIPLPPTPSSRSAFAPKNVMITYGLAFSDMTVIGTQYLVPPIDSIVRGSGSPLSGNRAKDLTVRAIVQAHFKSYARHFELVLSYMGGTLALSIQGTWSYGPDLQTGKKPDGLTTFGVGMAVTNMEWSDLSRVERGLSPLNGRNDLEGRRKWVQDLVVTNARKSEGRANRPTGKKDTGGLSLS